MGEKKQPQIREAARKYVYRRHAGEVTMSSKRQITIPAAVVRELELEPGMKLAVYVEGEEITLVPRKMNWFEYITTRKPSGIYGTTKAEVDAYLREVRKGWDEHARRFEGDTYIEEEEEEQESDPPEIPSREWTPEEVEASIQKVIEDWRARQGD